MSRTVTALYDSRSEAESARERLSSTVDVEKVRVLDHQSESGSSDGSSGGGWLSKLFMADDDRQTYHEGMRRGGFMLCAEVDSEEDANRIVSILEQTSPVDLNERSQSWRNEGWQTQDRSDRFAGSNSGDFSPSSRASDLENRSDSGERTVQEERIPIVDEQLNVGKREVERGGARVHSFVRETPVNEQVTLREENVTIERRPVNEDISEGDLNREGLLQDREIEMRATGEEAVVAKEAHVNEEIVVRKTESQHTENVHDSVRHTEVDVDGETDRNSRALFGEERDETSTSSTELENDGFGRR
jgi:uncharacterized protein (TIGR02271 family)